MSQLLQLAKEVDLERRLRMLCGFNVLLIAVSLAAWSSIVRIAADPLQWATWQYVSPRPGYRGYPLVMVWGLPLAGLLVAWALQRGGSTRIAVWAAGFPLLYLGTLGVCFHVLPLLIR